MKKVIIYILLVSAIFFLVSCGGGGGGGVGSTAFTISYDGNGAETGSAPARQSGDEDTPQAIAGNTGNLVKNGYLFDGWNTKGDGSGTDYAPGASYKGDSITLYAKWAAIFQMSVSQNAPALNSSASYVSGNSVATIIGLTERGKQLSSIFVPSTIDGVSVTSIGEGAFQGCTNIVKIAFAESVGSLGANAFSGCTGLTSIIFQRATPPEIPAGLFDGLAVKLAVPPESLDAYKGASGWDAYAASIDVLDSEIFTFEVAENKAIITGLTDYGKTLTTLRIPESIEDYPVAEIGQNAFKDCNFLTGNLVIPNGVTKIGEDAFNRCTGFTGNLVLPDSVTEIGKDAFKRCSGFTGNLVLPNNITRIGINAFQRCSGFTGPLTIPASVISIGNGAFYGCTGFTSLSLSEGIKEIGTCFNIPFKDAFDPVYGNFTVELGVFHGCTGLEGTLTIPTSVEIIGDSAFMGCENFVGTLTIPSNVKNIGNCAFAHCYGFDGNLNIPSSVTRIGYDAFECCNFDGTLTIGNGLTAIEEMVFYGCSDFTGPLSIPPSVTSIGYYAFSDCDNFSGTLTIPGSVKTIGERAFGECENITGLVISNGVISIGEDAFEECYGISGALTIPNSVTSIGRGTFADCKFTTVTIPASVTSIGAGAFGGNTITSMTVDSNNPVYCIEDGLLYTKSKTKILFCLPDNVGTLTIPATVTGIGCDAFSHIKNPITITMMSGNPPVGIDPYGDLEPDELKINMGCAADPPHDSLLTELRVPIPAEAAYKSSVGWGDYAGVTVTY